MEQEEEAILDSRIAGWQGYTVLGVGGHYATKEAARQALINDYFWRRCRAWFILFGMVGWLMGVMLAMIMWDS